MAANPKDLLDQDEDDDSPISKDVTNEFTPPEDTDDGGVIVKIRPDVDDSPTADEDDFYHNLVEDLDETNPGAVDRLGLDLLEYIERDKDSRKDRDEKYAEGIKRTGLGDEAPGGEAFEGASKAVHPMNEQGEMNGRFPGQDVPGHRTFAQITINPWHDAVQHGEEAAD